MNKNWLIILAILLCYTSCQNADNTEKMYKEAETEPAIPETLPLQVLDFSTIQFPSNWKNAGGAIADLNVEHDLQSEEGTGVLVCRENGEHLNTELEHGDIEVKVKVLVPKNSNSGLYFQGRYEVQILDSWKKETVNYGDLGGIYAHTTDEATGKDIGGSPPMVNAAKAPGLWQDFHILFRAPKFDENGNKMANAKFEFVYLNGHKIQENVEVEKPTIAHQLEGEAATGPIFIQGDHGPIAFKDFEYKRMGKDTVAISNIQYALYEGHWDKLPNFEELTPIKTGAATSFDKLEDLAGKKDKFGLVFTADINVPKDGDYLFTTIIDDGGNLYIDSTLLIHNVGEPGIGTERGLINLKSGKHSLKLSYFEEVWLALAVLRVEGPEMPDRALGAVDITQNWGKGNKNKAKVVATDRPELVRGFVDFKGSKKTHALTVGDPSGVHYTYDLRDGALLKSWRGAFADVTNMWVGRGASQTMLPENAAAEFAEGVPITQLNKPDGAWPEYRSDDYKNRGYRLDAAGRPIFLSSFKDLQIEDKVMPNGNGGIKRAINFSGTKANHYFRLAKGKKITKMTNGLYSVDGEYYLKVSAANPVSIRDSEVEDELVTTVGDQLSYELIW